MSFGIAAAVVGGAMLGGAFAPDAPDTSGVNDAARSNSVIAGRQQDLAEEQYADQKSLLDEYRPIMKDMIEKSVIAQDKATAQSDDAWGDYKNTWRPVEQQLAAKSLEYANPSRAEQEGQRAGSMAQTQLDRAQRETEMSLAQAGASPEKTAALLAAGRVSGAKNIGAAEYQGRSTEESKGMAYLDNAAKFGRNMPSTGIQTAALASQTSNQVQGGIGSLQSAVAAPAQAAAPLLAGAVSANNSAGSLFGSAAGLDFQGSLAKTNAIMGGASAGARLWGMSNP